MKGSKIKVQSDEYAIVVSLPYKHGMVKWGLMLRNNYSYSWQCLERPEHYRPERVEGTHKQYLTGKTLRGRMIRAAAANHVWWLLEKLKGVDMFERRTSMSKKETPLVVERNG